METQERDTNDWNGANVHLHRVIIITERGED